MTMECIDKSPVINVGQTFVTKFGNIKLVSVEDSGSGVIKVSPVGGYDPIMRRTTDYALESYYDGLITVKTNFFTLAETGAHFWVCGYVDPGPEKCDQIFELKDQNGNPINGNVQIGTTAMSVIGTGTILLEQGKSYTAVASFGDRPDQTKTFTACTGTIVFTFEEIKPIGKEWVFPFSKDITAYWENDTVRSCVTKIVKAIGGKSAYLEDGTKIVVVM